MLAVCVSSLSQNTDIDQVRRGRILPYLAINASEVDPLVKPAANPVVACVGNEVLNGLGLAVREILGEVGFRELMQRGAKSGVFHLETR